MIKMTKFSTTLPRKHHELEYTSRKLEWESNTTSEVFSRLYGICTYVVVFYYVLVHLQNYYVPWGEQRLVEYYILPKRIWRKKYESTY